MFEIINPYVAKILIAARDGNSIRGISKKINESYGWTYKWASELEKIGVFRRKKQEIKIDKSNVFYKALTNLMKTSFAENLSLNDAYLLPNLAGLDYIFTSTDAVFIWTKGGYNIGRSKDSYPIFIEILEKDKEAWEKYFSEFKIGHTFKNERKKGIYFVISIAKTIKKEYCEQMPVLSLKETVSWARKFRFNFQPALEMLDEMYNLNIREKYKEAYA